ncbi:MAG TPA: ABC transporter substrate-binding protein [Gaiellales bacterium]|jgi:polar amino acid transport system substrate-binding protein|nr:ABC transporter substrate-binding protein [Gaiellales bacterium]
MRKLVWILPVVVLAAAASACGTAKSGATAGSSAPGSNPCAVKNLALLHPGTLTIGTDNPAYSPYFTGGPGHSWTGQFNNDPYTGKGFEDAVAYAVAKQMGFSNAQVKWNVTHFNQSFAPGPKNFDFYLAQVSITSKRAQTVDFSSPYYTENQAVVALKSNRYAHATSISALHGAKLGTQLGTTSYSLIQDFIKPGPSPGAYHTLNDAINALKAHQIDGIVVDLPTAFYMTAVQIPDSTIVGQFPVSEGAGDHFGLVLAKGSPLTSCVDKAIAALKSDGTLDQIQTTWLSNKANAPVLH